MEIKFKHELYSIVYLVTDVDQHPRMVTGYLIRANATLYELSCATGVTYHLKEEISTTKAIF